MQKYLQRMTIKMHFYLQNEGIYAYLMKKTTVLSCNKKFHVAESFHISHKKPKNIQPSITSPSPYFGSEMYSCSQNYRRFVLWQYQKTHFRLDSERVLPYPQSYTPISVAQSRQILGHFFPIFYLKLLQALLSK